MKQANNAYTHLLSRIANIMFQPERINQDKQSNSRGGTNGKDKVKVHTQYIDSRYKSVVGTCKSLDIIETFQIYKQEVNETNPINKGQNKYRRNNQDKNVVIVDSEDNSDDDDDDDDDDDVDGSGKVESMAQSEDVFLKSLGSAKMGILRLLLVWVFNDQIIQQENMDWNGLVIKDSPINYKEKQQPLNNEQGLDHQDRSLVLSVHSTVKFEKMKNLTCLVKTPNHFLIHPPYQNNDVGHVWKSCRYYDYTCEGRHVAITLSESNFNNYIEKEALAIKLNLQMLILRKDTIVYIWSSAQSVQNNQLDILPPSLYNQSKQNRQVISNGEKGFSFIINLADLKANDYDDNDEDDDDNDDEEDIVLRTPREKSESSEYENFRQGV